MGLELYSKIEEYLDFDEEVKELHKAFLTIIFEKSLDDIIDIGCGQGGFMMHLRANDISTYGIDLSSQQIRICQNYGLNADAVPLSKVSDTFNCATAIFDVINYIPQDEILNFFTDTFKILNKDGYFIFDINTLFGFVEVAQGSLTINLEDKFIAIDANFEDEKLNTNITFFNENKKGFYIKEEDNITQYYHETKYLKSKLQEIGFIIEDVINFHLHTDEEADKLIFICKKS